jgi:hypothetical protein
MKLALLGFIWLLAASPTAFAVNWELLTPDLKISGATITSVNKWTLLESFATLGMQRLSLVQDTANKQGSL